MNYLYGIVEDRNDPLKVGRVRVRVHGVHTDDKSKIASPDLPWSHVIMPATTAGLGGFGIQHSLVEGTTVFGFFRDEDMQDFVVMGVQQGISQQGYKETITDELILRDIDKGFNDPRRNTEADYDGTNDGLNPPSAPNRPNSLSLSLETSPHLLKDAGIKYDGTGSTREEYTEADKTLPYYPLVKDATDVNVFSTGDAIYDSRDMSEYITNAKSNATPMYPFNKALYTESGHIVELDDTRDNERISIEHRTGTFLEIDKDGNQIHRVVNDNYAVICKDNELYVGGKVNIKVLGDVDLTVVDGNVTSILEKGNLKADMKKGTTDVTSEGKITITGKNTTEIISDTTITGTLTVTEATDLKSTLKVKGAQTNKSSIVADGEIQTKQGNSPKLSTHKHEYVDSAPSPSVVRTSKKPK